MRGTVENSLETMIVKLTIRLVTKHIEAIAAERFIAFMTSETRSVPFTLELTVR